MVVDFKNIFSILYGMYLRIMLMKLSDVVKQKINKLLVHWSGF